MSARPKYISVIAVLMLIFGIAEVATGINHNFFGLTTQVSRTSTLAGVSVGLLYVLAGTLTLTWKRRAWKLAIACLLLDVVGRIAMVATGLFPTGSAKQIFSIIAGTTIAAIFALILWRKLHSLPKARV